MDKNVDVRDSESNGIKQRMRGNVKFYLEPRAYGFITGEDKKDYYFRKDSVKNAGARIFDGLPVTFFPSLSSKGYYATKIIADIVDEYSVLYEVPRNVERTKTDQVRGWQIINKLDKTISVESKDLSEVRQKIMDLAKSIGANAVVNEKYNSRSDTSNGSYYYSVHMLSGNPAQVARPCVRGILKLVDFPDMQPLYVEWEKKEAEKERKRKEQDEQDRFQRRVLMYGVIGLIIFLMLAMKH
jgi:cold shock CspA family protein